MTLLFVTGGNAAFFNTMMICLQSFGDRLPGHRLLVCDYGLTPEQAKFLAGEDCLLKRPPDVPRDADVFRCKAALLGYLRHGGFDVDAADAVVWIDGDLTLMDVGIDEVRSVAGEMRRLGGLVAACGEPSGMNMGQMAALPDMRPFVTETERAGIPAAAPYFSTGLFFCRSAALLTAWDALTRAVVPHTLFEQNMFNIALNRDHAPVLLLDCEEWQAQGNSLDAVWLRDDGRPWPSAFVGDKPIKILHSTSPNAAHLVVGPGRLGVFDVELIGQFKLLFAEPLRMHQLGLLARFVRDHRDALLRTGVCRIAGRPADGFQFSMLPTGI